MTPEGKAAKLFNGWAPGADIVPHIRSEGPYRALPLTGLAARSPAPVWRSTVDAASEPGSGSSEREGVTCNRDR